MDILIPDSWLRRFLDTKVKPDEIAKYLSLCGPSIERIKKTKDEDYIYSVEITTNRVDCASVLGIAREASAILPRFGISAKLKIKKEEIKNKYDFKNKVKYLDAIVDSKLCPRFTAVLIKNVKLKDSPEKIKNMLLKVGVRPINNLVDVSNYIMHELGQPVHTFDYDKIVGSKMILRESRVNELVTTLDGKKFKLDGGDIVIEDGSGKLIDLCGIMGGENSAIDSSTKNVLLFVQNYNKHVIRKTSMKLDLRTEAAVLFEKGLDSENIKPAILLAIDLIEKLSGGKTEKEVLDIYPKSYKTKMIKVDKLRIDKIIGIEISTKDISKYLKTLGFEVYLQGETLQVTVPSWRADDIDIQEDIAEEIARIYGYHNLPCILMGGELPKPQSTNNFKVELDVKQILKSLGGFEIYNLSLVEKGQLKLSNPLGPDSGYLRDNLKDSLIQNIKDNPQEKNYIHIFEMANVYLARKNDLPEEILTLAGIIKNGDYRKSKGIVQTLLKELLIDYTEKLEDGKGYFPNQRLEIYSDKERIGEYGNLENNLFTYEFDMQKLINCKKTNTKFKEAFKYPPQVEDLTLVIPEKTYVGEVMKFISDFDIRISNLELIDIYQNNYTFNIEYQDENKTLTDKEVKEIRNKILSELKSKFGITIKG
ncbi:phenylalanine--tRNA ligase subunit beta [Candidatus Woesebacteria bacterium GWC2_33_12]|uniref:Phenylalanine--tRNA ligase beta subunit n=1 Tax=Candidatus Woesebacteria bacterium GW2011_GWB1_33_22 TaxID=1618566 RepID=A0A0F9ZLV8_9BACT|nr:MAG: Phenylalanine-tRNA ligase beta subunit [Candidatus Woesebacteria bacterium GW2011_GWC2_33_12]KKP42460.1 MAG: Phenylalanine-tRNA ligase beta subunit [Candidatus Woesebacteria bacterium GW2011_GWA2_33_20]KKP45203.1 MAG: Phenylalanine-tRNA ligase beta subunit [Candidatus Woesebacteria bacterium GW2011_GWB1_33_22]KKP46202.1 MAG: phenylalanyl-tRNA synthetase, beta subunit, phenylalanyl-tRNA synthetase beta chain [Microgenomates group bacterium GW2011_GWC1_33_28]KKP50872.1 MAG: Phenylalanine-